MSWNDSSRSMGGGSGETLEHAAVSTRRVSLYNEDCSRRALQVNWEDLDSSSLATRSQAPQTGHCTVSALHEHAQ